MLEETFNKKKSFYIKVVLDGVEAQRFFALKEALGVRANSEVIRQAVHHLLAEIESKNRTRKAYPISP
jgi:hypothetical protein